jgi:NAD+ kinase
MIRGVIMKKVVGIFGGSFNPPCIHHVQIIEYMKRFFDVLIVVPCGIRPDKQSANVITPVHRKNMLAIALSDMDDVIIDYHDIDCCTYTPTYLLQKRYEDEFSDGEIWHIVGGDIIEGGQDGASEIHRTWSRGCEIWQDLNFLVLRRPGYQVSRNDLPPQSRLVGISNIFGSGTMAREYIAAGETTRHLVNDDVSCYIVSNNLYKT